MTHTIKMLSIIKIKEHLFNFLSSMTVSVHIDAIFSNENVLVE